MAERVDEGDCCVAAVAHIHAQELHPEPLGGVVDRHHLVALVGLLYGLYALVVWTAGWIFGKRLPIWRPSPRAIGIYVAVFLIYAVVLRNLPWAPFNWFYIENLT
ncbi:MAG: hypothetical protein GEV12_10905 [Micromonosporaceae bacterium]|nr:hypothetical protein [Micromonosporaceae bacterium]